MGNAGMRVLLSIQLTVTLLLIKTYGKYDDIDYSPMQCQKKCLERTRCGSWTVHNHDCSLSEERETPPLYFRRSGEKIHGGRKTTEDVENDALVSFHRSFELLNDSIPNDNYCEFFKLRRNLEAIAKNSNESVDQIQLATSFLSENDALLADILGEQKKLKASLEKQVKEKGESYKRLKK